MSGITQDKCCHPYCRALQIPNGGHTVHGEPQYRKYCQVHYEERKSKNAGFNSIAEYTAETFKKKAAREGISVTALRRKNHKYRWAMKDYCENVDGRLGFVCTTTIFPDKGMLHVDHIDGTPINNNPLNYQTLCACCHAFKTNTNKDYSTPGRKTFKELIK
jgi:hypothetical protein